MKEKAFTLTFCKTNETCFNEFFLEMVQKLIFAAISCGWEAFYHKEQNRAVIFIFSKDLGIFRKKKK
jgi:hypothetical protein